MLGLDEREQLVVAGLAPRPSGLHVVRPDGDCFRLQRPVAYEVLKVVRGVAKRDVADNVVPCLHELDTSTLIKLVRQPREPRCQSLVLVYAALPLAVELALILHGAMVGRRTGGNIDRRAELAGIAISAIALLLRERCGTFSD
ncbi:hypothetical protein AWB90_18100 [Mycobacterium paraense]|uniref:Uncharacterized protein n=1 Tax=Mycobacterium paraense TaxID=767916 RepID=A0A1X2A752_9MYCO|nr:hypothetical protein AWB90_18100 [Mycobacterium paraense]